MNTKIVLAIDPGTAKCGMALVRREPNGKLSLLWRAVAPVDEMLSEIEAAHDVESFTLIIVGSGTNSKPIVASIRDKFPSMGILVVDEQNTSLQARERYWEHNPRRGWRRLLPSTLQTPPTPVDDFVAFILAERVLLG